MAQRYNSASRLVVIINSFLTFSNNSNVIDCWGTVFGIPSETGFSRAYLIAEKLSALFEEVKKMECALREVGYEEELYIQPINVAKRAFSPEFLPTGTAQIKSWLENDVKVQFRYMVAALPSDSQAFRDEDLLQLNELIAQLQEIVQTSTAHPAVLNVVRNHLALLLRALAMYPISGPSALTEALKLMAVDLYENRDALGEFENSEEVGLLKRTWQHAKNMAATTTTSDVITLATLGWETVKAIV